MSFDASVSIVWGGDERTFRLGIDQLLALEDRCDVGCGELLVRMSTARWRLRDVQETIRLGLIGAGVEGSKARALVNEHVAPGTLATNSLVAQAILTAAVVGTGEKVGKAEAVADAPGANASPPPPSTETALFSTSHPSKSDA